MIRFVLALSLLPLFLSISHATDVGPLFPTLDNGSGVGTAPNSCSIGQAVAGKLSQVVIDTKDASGNATVPTSQTDGSKIYRDVNAAPLDGWKPTYRAASTASFSSASAATDICTLTGSNTKTVRVTRVLVTGIQTTQSEVNFFLLKRSTADTDGTSSQLTAVPLDSNDAAATAVARQYTANPTTGTLVGNIDSFKQVVPVATLGSSSAPTLLPEESYGFGPMKSVVLRGANEVLAINLGSSTIIGGSFLCRFEWTEE